MKNTKTSHWVSIVSAFESQMRADGKSDNTIISYLQAIVQFTKFHGNVNNVNDITQESVNNWLMKFNPRKATLNLKKNALKKFLGFLKSEYGLKKEIKINIKDLPRQEPGFLTIQEQDRLLQFVKGLGEYSQRYVMIKLMLFTGLRISEVTNLRFADVEGNTLILRQTKNGNIKRKHLKNDIASMLMQYVLARRNKYPLNEKPSGCEDFIFMSKYGGEYRPFTRQAVNQVIKKLARQVGITKKVSPHMLRHSFSVRFLNCGGSLLGLKNYLGHRNIQTTEIYLHISDEQLKEELERL